MQKQPVYIVSVTFLLLSVIGLSSHSHLDSVTIYETNKKSNLKPAVTVGMTNTMKFTPDTVRIKAGETVRWENSSLLAHSVTADPSQLTIEGSAKLPKGAKPFDSGMMDPEQTFQHTFKVPGTYQYFCIPHEGAKMHGWVIVEE